MRVSQLCDPIRNKESLITAYYYNWWTACFNGPSSKNVYPNPKIIDHTNFPVAQLTFLLITINIVTSFACVFTYIFYVLAVIFMCPYNLFSM